MNTPETANAVATPAEQPKGTKKPRVRAPRANVTPKKAKSAKNGSPAKKTAKRAKNASGARDSSKSAKVLDLLKRPDGTTLKELMKAEEIPRAPALQAFSLRQSDRVRDRVDRLRSR
jgi:hypothetical protein